MRSSTLKIVLIAVVALAVTAPAPAAPVADVLLGVHQVQWVPQQAYAGFQLTVSGPAGIVERTFASGDDVLFDLAALAGDVDGTYTWELIAAPVLDAEARSIMAEARAVGSAGGDRTRPSSVPPRTELIQGGTFQVSGGALVQPSTESQAPASLRPAGTDQVGSVTGDAQFIAAAAQVFATDLIVQGSACIGQDCTSGESFGFDTIRIKENNTRIKFDDTSNSGSFPNNDWELVANDSGNGGRNAFYIRDVSAGREVFTVEAAAPNYSMYLDSTGFVGMGTNAPVVQAHMKDGNTPTLRLDQDQSAGFNAQVWDIAGNEANFFIRDVTSGSDLVLRIKPGAPEDSLFIAADGDIGLGTNSPSALLHVKDSAAGGIFIETDGAATLKMDDTTQTNTWQFFASNAFQFDNLANTGVEFQVNPNGDVFILGQLTTNGPSCGSGCDRVFASDYELESIEEHAEYMWANMHLPAVGPTVPNAPINLTEKAGNMLNELEKAHIYIAQLNDRLKEKASTIDALEATKAQLMAQQQALNERLERLEKQAAQE